MTNSNSNLWPELSKNATPAGGSAVRFDLDYLKTTSSPVGGLSSFSFAIVFRADGAGSSGGQWYNNTGIVDAEQGGVTADWGMAIDSNGYLGWGTGSPDQTLYSSSAPSLVDSNYHAAVFTWGSGSKNIYIDNLWTESASGAATATRNSAGMAFGGILTGANPRFIGDIVEVRFYDTSLSGLEATNLILELQDTHISAGSPIIYSFTASTNQILINSPVTLAWNVTNATSRKILPTPGTVAATGNVQVFPRTNTTYTLTATNALGVRTSQVSVFVDQGIPTATNQAVNTLRNEAKAISLTGSDPQGSNLTYVVVANPAHGALAGAGANRTYTPATNFTGNDQFTFKVNDGEFDSPLAAVTIQVLQPPAAPSAVTISTTNINSGTVPGSFIASLGAIDINPGDTHTFNLVSGFGNNAAFAISGNQLRAGDTFVGPAGASFSIRVRATDSTALWVEQNFSLTVTTNSQSIVINEIHYNPSDNTIREEFIELYNPTASPVDVSSWEVSDGVNYTLPPGAVIPPFGFLVVAQDPATIQARYGRTAFGPWSGELSSDGEKITLKDGNGQKIDSVDYNSEFPWPISADGEGASMALVNPALDNDLGSSWRSEFPPTPGATNGVFTANAAPNIRQVQHTPQSPTSTSPIVITAKVTDPEGVASVQLEYQLVTPGNYIPAVLPVPVAQLISNPALGPTSNPAYTNSANWTALPMVDTGAGGDAVANDSIYTAVLPAQANRVLVRYRIVVTDALGASRRAPFEDDDSLNFACFVYDGVPAYQGVTAQALQTLPICTLIARDQDVVECTAYDGAYQIPQFQGSFAHPARFVFNWPGTIVYDGVVYDNIRYRLHGANGRYQPGKRNWRFQMNSGNYFAARDQFGKKYDRKWSHITMGKGSNNRLVLTFALNESVNYFLWNKVGVPSPDTIFLHYRVLTTAQEAPGQYTGDFWGLNWAQEEYDGRFLDAHNLEKGNLYKLINASFSSNLADDMVGQQRYQGPFAVTNGTDGAAIQNALLGSQTDDWIQNHVNVDEWYHFQAVSEAVRNYDTWPNANKNAAWYFEPPYDASNDLHGRFWVLPWDTDSTWGSTWNSGQDLVYNGIFNAGSHPELIRDYGNTVREVRDLLFQADQINPVIDAFAARIQAFVPADLARWSNSPASGGSYASLTAGAGFASPALTGGLAGCAQDMKNFMFVGGNYPWWIDRQNVGAGGWITRLDTLGNDVNIPALPTIYYVGQPGYPMNSLTFECLPFSDPQGAGTFAGMQWRLAEVADTNQIPADARVVPPMEWDTLWNSGTITAWSNRITIPSQYVQTNHIYRARVRHLDNSGRWSHWSAPAQFSVTAVDTISVLRQNLRFTEIMYHPPDFGAYLSDDLEFLELQNLGGTTLDLSGLTFTAGINFSFSNSTVLLPGQRFLLGRNAAALQARYPGLVVNGIYTGKLDNGGETIRLSTPIGETVIEVTYKDSLPWPVTADGLGWSLVLDDAVAGIYRASTAIGGSPGAVDPVSTIPHILITELLTHTDPPLLDTFELFNPTVSAVNIGGWFLSDKADVPKKFRIPNNTIINPGGYIIFTQDQYNTNGLDLNLNSTGDEAYLFSGDANTNLTGYVHGAAFGAAEHGVSFGRYVNSLGFEDFIAMSRLTLGTNNSRPLVGPMVISEIMFEPPRLGTNENYDAEFIELQNVTGTNALLYARDFPTNTWRLGNAVSYSFPTNIIVPVDGRVLVVGFDPRTNTAALATFRSTYGVGTNVPIFGPWSGHLNNDGETIELEFPDQPEIDGSVPYVMVEKVIYLPIAPWPTGAAGTGLSLQRGTLLSYADEPTNWFAALPGAGTLSPRTSQDMDGDGVPDWWELQHGTDAFVADGTADPDGDGFDNYSEWIAGTDPLDANSSLRLQALFVNPGSLNLCFTAMAGRNYRILASPTLNAAVWSTVTNIASATTNRNLSISQPISGSQFYRVATP